MCQGAVVSEEEIATELIHVGDVLRVLPGSAVPTDGVVVLGRSAVDEAMITGMKGVELDGAQRLSTEAVSPCRRVDASDQGRGQRGADGNSE